MHVTSPVVYRLFITFANNKNARRALITDTRQKHRSESEIYCPKLYYREKVANRVAFCRVTSSQFV